MNAPLAKHTFRVVDSDLVEIENHILRMLAQVGQQLDSVIEALRGMRSEFSDGVVVEDAKLTTMLTEVERLALRFIALRQPVAVDLRATVAAMRMAHHLERMGDYTKDVARRIHTLSNQNLSCTIEPVIQMAVRLAEAIKDSVVAYTNRDVGKALRVWSGDEEIDLLNNAAFSETLQHMSTHSQEVIGASHLLFMARDMERLGDHLTDVVEDIYFMITGEPVREPRPKADATPHMMG
ncbi:phosphate uptake regulator, PhoU [Magnetococcus marinus MC-1]|uniref:Phosphate-specific transport system accessory protein PhoU n=1 Tax=Magnetococcus marinus (strain ATCC BAA-1437 / JCM 17883 / MC-1) TaxID=156889 RepID=A0LDJ6_MAGMM|nr:phosphate signaling complex protein PhoU [Magnetococcus marinus]ABK46039.1 phosphate uptake regulator, PhoU [Magnetococcus marinus MC-1]